MNALVVLFIVIAGIPGALTCFRSGRRALPCGVMALAIGLSARMDPGYGQSRSTVECHIGTWTGNVPDDACQAVSDATRKLVPREPRSVRACAEDINGRVRMSQAHALDVCNAIYRGWMIEAERLMR
jgi:hypothetical protein